MLHLHNCILLLITINEKITCFKIQKKLMRKKALFYRFANISRSLISVIGFSYLCFINCLIEAKEANQSSDWENEEYLNRLFR